MKNRLQYVLCELDALENSARAESPLHRLDARSKLLTTVVFLTTMLSVPLAQLSEILLYALFPLLTASMGGLRYGTIFRRSLYVVPFAALIGMFNIFCDREPALRIGTLVVSEGWIAFLAILLRGLLSVQALLVLIGSTGFFGLCHGLQRLGVPRLFTMQLLFVYRYLYVLLDEALRLSWAREARSFGRRALPLPVWGTLVAQLLVRTCDRAERIHRAMLARGFTGRLPDCGGTRTRWQRTDTLFLAGWSSVLIAARLLRPVETLTLLLS